MEQSLTVGLAFMVCAGTLVLAWRTSTLSLKLRLKELQNAADELALNARLQDERERDKEWMRQTQAARELEPTADPHVEDEVYVPWGNPPRQTLADELATFEEIEESLDA